jgi:hypothetical protein
MESTRSSLWEAKALEVLPLQRFFRLEPIDKIATSLAVAANDRQGLGIFVYRVPRRFEVGAQRQR